MLIACHTQWVATIWHRPVLKCKHTYVVACMQTQKPEALNSGVPEYRVLQCPPWAYLYHLPTHLSAFPTAPSPNLTGEPHGLIRFKLSQLGMPSIDYSTHVRTSHIKIRANVNIK